MGYRIRQMKLSDHADLMALWRGVPGLHLDEQGDSRAGFAAFLRRNRGLSLVAHDKGAVVGSIMVGHDGRRGFIYHLAVAPACRGAGIGRALVARGLRSLARLNIPKCSIFVKGSNAGGQAFWRKIGWTVRDDILILQHETHP